MRLSSSALPSTIRMCSPFGHLPELFFVVPCAVFAAAFDLYTVFIRTTLRQGFLVANVFAFTFISFTVLVSIFTGAIHLTAGTLTFHPSFKGFAPDRFVLLFWAVFGVFVWH